MIPVQDHSRLYVDWGKLGTILMVLVGTTVLGITDTLTGDTVAVIYAAASGYVFGNGRLAVTGKPTSPMVAQQSSLTESPRPGPAVEGDTP